VPFPAVVVCNHKENDINPLAYPERLLNAANIECQFGESCTNPLREKVLPILREAMNIVADSLNSRVLVDNMEKIPETEDKESVKDDIAFLAGLLAGEEFTFEEILHSLVEYVAIKTDDISIIRKLQPFNATFCASDLDFWADDLEFHAVKNQFKDKSQCFEHLNHAVILYLMADFIATGKSVRNLGSIMATFLPIRESLLVGQDPFQENKTSLDYPDSLVELDYEKQKENFIVNTLFSYIANLLFTNELAEHHISLLDIAFLAGRWPANRIFPASFYKHSESMVYSLRPWFENSQSEITFYSGHCIKKLERWLNGEDEEPPCSSMNEGICCVPSKALNSFATFDNWNELMMAMSTNGLRPLDFSHEQLTKPFREKSMFAEVESKKLLDDFASVPYCLLMNGSNVSRPTRLGHVQLQKCTEKFKAISTTRGICLAYNSLDLLAKSKFKEAMEFSYGGMGNDQLQMGVKGMDDEGFTFALVRAKNKMMRSLPSYDVSFSNPFTSFDFHTQVGKVQFTKHTTVKVRPMALQTDENLRNARPSNRHCRFADEKVSQDSVFNSYSQLGCQFDNSLQKARDLCNCTPWDFPLPPKAKLEEHIICDVFGYFCFERNFNQNYKSQTDCMPDCHTLSYEVIEKTVESLPSLVCNQPWALELAKRVFKSSQSEVIGLLRNLNYDRNYGDDRWVCLKLFQNDVALITVQLSDNGYIKSVRKLRVDLAEKMATLGKLATMHVSKFELLSF